VSAQRIRVWFRKGERLRYISHLDVLRFWERAIRRAGLPLAYSQGYTPHPRLAFASPLPLGFVGESEIMDVTLEERMDIEAFRERLAAETPEDLRLIAASEVATGAPAPQASLAWADYTVEMTGVAPGEAERVAREFLARSEMMWNSDRRERSRAVDLRAGVSRLSIEPSGEGVRLRLRARAHQEVTIRPEDVLAALFPGGQAMAIARTAVILDEPSPAREAWRRRGRFEE